MIASRFQTWRLTKMANKYVNTFPESQLLIGYTKVTSFYQVHSPSPNQAHGSVLLFVLIIVSIVFNLTKIKARFLKKGEKEVFQFAIF